MTETTDQPELGARSAWQWLMLAFLVAAGAIVAMEIVDAARNFAWWKSVGGEGSWLPFVARNLLIPIACMAIAFFWGARRRPAYATPLVIAALLWSGMLWVGQRM